MVLITACWEAYIEDVAAEAFDHILKNCSDASSFPTRVRVLAARSLREAKDERAIWVLAGNGWKTVLTEHRDKTLEYFHTPKHKNVDDLFFDLLGLGNLSASWRWQGMSAKSAAKKLNNYIEIRGKVAHRVGYSTPIPKAYAEDYLKHVELLVSRTDETVHKYAKECSGVQPWPGSSHF